jgi:hypothetical protein
MLVHVYSKLQTVPRDNKCYFIFEVILRQQCIVFITAVLLLLFLCLLAVQDVQELRKVFMFINAMF